ncbi:MAG TPA: NADH-quinone oxidoreductase subunit NuoG [bacterium]|nr:NADH-quinone oxidoreductase subunit NuoG [bacterium]
MPPELVTLTIDGKQVQAPKGTLLIEACAQHGTYVPRFCYHEHLVPYAGCRMCLVEVEKMPKLATACSTPVTEGMVVHTDTGKVREGRQGVLEFILVSHPLDCPVCDKGGECDLQDQTQLFGPPDSRMVDVRRFHPNYDLSPTIKLDYNRCILCKRCVRFTEEIGDDDRLIFRERGAYTEIDTQTGEPFDSRFGGTVIEYCPVGALTDQVFRFRARPWEIKERPSTCTLCAVGCAETLHVRSNKVVRIFNRAKPDLNGYYICDKGRFGHEFTVHSERVLTPLLREGSRLESVSWEEAIGWAADRLTQAVQTHGPQEVAGVIGADRSLEELYAFKRLMGALGTPHVDHYPSTKINPPAIPFFLNRLATFDQAVQSKSLVLWDAHLFDELPMVALRIKQSRMGLVEAWGPKNTSEVLSIAAARTYHSRYPWVRETVIPRHLHREALVALARQLSQRGRLPRELASALARAEEMVRPSGLLDPTLITALATRLTAPDAVLAIGHQPLLQDTAILELLELVVRAREAAGGKLKLLLGVPSANTLGAWALGIVPAWSKRGQEGACAEAIANHLLPKGRPKALVLAHVDAIRRWPTEALDGLKNVETLIAVSYFLDEITSQAHLVLPGLTPYEVTGVTVNPEGRLQEVTRGVTEPVRECRTLLNVCSDIALRMGTQIPTRREEALAALAKLTPALRHAPEVTFVHDAWLDGELQELPQVEFFTTEAGNQPAAPNPNGGAFQLLVRRPFWVPSAMLDHSPRAGSFASWAARLHPTDGRRLGVATGDAITLSTTHGHLTAPVVLTRGVPEGYVEVEEGHGHGRIPVLGALEHGTLTVKVDRAGAREPAGQGVAAGR